MKESGKNDVNNRKKKYFFFFLNKWNVAIIVKKKKNELLFFLWIIKIHVENESILWFAKVFSQILCFLEEVFDCRKVGMLLIKNMPAI